MESENITTVERLREVFNEADEVYVTIKFGVCEQSVKVTKTAMREIVWSIIPGTTPEGYEMYSDVFASYHKGILLLG